MARMIFIREIILSEKEPRLCPTCKKEDKLEKEMNLEFEKFKDSNFEILEQVANSSLHFLPGRDPN